MRKHLSHLMIGMAISVGSIAQTITTGPSSSQSPYLLPVATGYSITSIITATQSVGNYTVAGLLDGAGAYDNNDGTFTMLINHEMGNTQGAVHAHGQTGAFVSKWVINKTTLAVVSGSDLIQNVNLWNPATSTYSTYNAVNTSTLARFTRFCGADLPEISAFYNSYTGKGTQERILMNGEESGNEGRMMAHIATGPNAGTSYELPYLGRFSCENQVANPRRSDKTIVVGMDDTTPGQVYVYVGNKMAAGNEIVKAGLTGGILYGVGVQGLLNEISGSFPAANTTFSLINLGSVQAITGSSLNTISNNLGVTNFLRPEDGTWDPSNPSDFYFATTNAFNSPTRLWRLRFTDIENPQLGGTITAVLDGTEGGQMFDNIGIDNSGHILLQEDTGNQTYIGRIWEYTIATDVVMPIAEHDPNRFASAAPNFLTTDEESSGIFDAQAILGAGKFLFVDQAHYAIPSPVVDGGQILLLNSAKTASSNPEVNVQGNAVNIPLGNTATSSADNTSFGTLNLGLSVTKSFNIQNTGTGPLVVSNLFMSGTNAGDFTFVTPPAFPFVVAPGASQTFTVNFSPALLGTRNATISVNNNDFNENLYDYAIQGIGAAPEINLEGNNVTIADGNNTTSATNNTDFGLIVYNTTLTKNFRIQNTGTGTLTVSGINITGSGNSVFTIINAPSFPLTLIAGGSQTFDVQYQPLVAASHTAVITVVNNDSDEANYDYKVSGAGGMDVGINPLQKDNSFASLYPNPAKDLVTLKLSLEKNAHVIVTVTDVLGKVALVAQEKDLEKGERYLNLNTSNLKNGTYFVTINMGDKTSSIKLVISH